MRPGIRREMSPHLGVKKGATGYARGAPHLRGSVCGNMFVSRPGFAGTICRSEILLKRRNLKGVATKAVFLDIIQKH